MSAPFSASLPVWPRKSHHRVTTTLTTVHLRKRLKGVLPKPLVRQVGVQTVRLKVPHRRHGNPALPKRTRKTTAEVHSRQHVLVLRVQLVERTAKPPSSPTFVGSAVCQMSIERKWERFGLG